MKIKKNQNKYYVRCEIVKEQDFDYNKKILTPEEAIKLVEHLKNSDREHFVCIYLNTQNIVLGIETISIGTIETSIVDVKIIMKSALLLSASGIILVHNHPSGIAEPSEQDKDTTKKLISAGEILNIEIVDHIIISTKENYSFKEHHLI